MLLLRLRFMQLILCCQNVIFQQLSPFSVTFIVFCIICVVYIVSILYTYLCCLDRTFLVLGRFEYFSTSDVYKRVDLLHACNASLRTLFWDVSI